jgi:predicted metal-binding transcription factor (methanogenesis marker protein 9)
VKTVTFSEEELMMDKRKLAEEALEESSEASSQFLKIYDPNSD